jgi:Ras GTPase-activating-like protein IQGAP2/3
MSLEEMRSGVIKQEKSIPFHQALKDPDTRAEYIRREAKLNYFLESMTHSYPRSSSSPVVGRNIRHGYHKVDF